MSVLTLLSINNYYYRRGGAEVVFLEQNRLLEEREWRVIPFSMVHEKNYDSEWSEYFVDEIEFGNDYSLLQKVTNSLKVMYSFEAQKKISTLVDQVQPDIAHAHNVYHHISPAIFNTLKSKGVPTVLTLHDLKIACPAYKMLADDGVCERCKEGSVFNVVKHKCIKGSTVLSAVVMLETMVQRLMGTYSKGVDRFVVPSRFYLEKFVEWGWPRDRFTYIPNFVDISRMTPKGSPGDYFVFFGRLGPEKGIKTLVLAAAKSGVKVKIAGTGPLEDELKELIEKTGANVELLGYRVGEELFDVIRNARAVVLPSEWYENAPISIMEAYALERPVIGANIGGIPEMIREDETGALFESTNVDDLSEVLTKFDRMDDETIISMGRTGRQWVELDFTVDRYIERLTELYQELGVKC